MTAMFFQAMEEGLAARFSGRRRESPTVLNASRRLQLARGSLALRPRDPALAKHDRERTRSEPNAAPVEGGYRRISMNGGLKGWNGTLAR